MFKSNKNLEKNIKDKNSDVTDEQLTDIRKSVDSEVNDVIKQLQKQIKKFNKRR